MSRNRNSRILQFWIGDSGKSGLKVFGWVQKNKKSGREGDVEWQYARNAEWDEDDTTIDMTDALVQEKHPKEGVSLKRRTHQIRPKDKVPLEIVCVAYERAKWSREAGIATCQNKLNKNRI